MAAAMARGWAGAEGGPKTTLFCDLDADRARSLSDEVRGEVRPSLRALAVDSDLVVLAVKPAALDAVAEELDGKAPALVSVLAATSTPRLSGLFPGVPVLRVMPNQPVAVRRGVLCHAPAVGMSGELHGMVLRLLGELGTLVPLEERLMDAAMAIMSCSPAYIALVAEALARGGEKEGLEPRVAGDLVSGALAGTAELLRERDPGTIREAVAPPGGATEAGLAQLEGVVDDAFMNAVEASLERVR